MMRAMRTLAATLSALSIGLLACKPQAAPTPPAEGPSTAQASTTPESAGSTEAGDSAPDDAKQDPETAKKDAPPRKVPEGSIAVGTFNLRWAFDNLEEQRERQARPHVAPDDDAWFWKRDAVAKVLAEEGLDIVAVQEVGGERELGAIVQKIEELGGPDYRWAFVPSEDKHTGQHVGILSKFPISNERRLEMNIRKQMAADIELPTGDVVTVVAIHARTGQYPAYRVDRRKQARSVKNTVDGIARERPVLLLGSMNSRGLPYEDDYTETSAGIFSGKTSKSEDDDCQDSAEFGPATRTTVDEHPFDRIYSCGLEMRDAVTSGHALIVRKELDPQDAPWHSIPVDKAPFRDVSDHYVVWAEVALPKKTEGTGEAKAAP